MTPYQRRRLSFGAAVVSSGKTIGLNSTESLTFSHAGYYTNLWNAVQWDYHYESGTALPANAFTVGWVVNNIPATTKYFTYLVNNMPGDVGTWKAGKYHILWDGGADPTVTITGSSFYVAGSITRISAGHWTFQTTGLDVTNSNNNLGIHFENTTGATITAATMKNEAVVHDSNLALWQSGSWDKNVNPDYLAWAGANVGRFRMAKCSGTENSKVTSDISRSLVTENWKFWGIQNYLIGPPGSEWSGVTSSANGDPVATGMPYSFAAKLCAKLGQAILHASMPLGSDDAMIAAIGAQIQSVPQFTGQVLGEMGNENWNGGYRGPDGTDAFNWLNTTYKTLYNAAPYNANLLNGRESEAHAQLRCKKGLVAGGLSASRVILAYCSQYIVPSGYGPIMSTLNYVDANNVFGYGVKAFKTILNDTSGAFLAAPYNTPTKPDGTWLFNAGYAEYDWLTQTDEQIKAFFVKGQDGITAYTAQLCADVVTTIGPKVQRLCYEWGHQLNASCSGFAGLNIKFNINVTNSTMVFNVAGQLSGNPNPGDQWCYYYNNNGNAGEIGTPNGLAQDYAVYLQQSTAHPGEYYAFTTRAAATTVYASDAAAKAAAIVFTNVNNTKPFWGGPVTRLQQAGARIQTWLDGQYGADMYQSLFANTIGPNLWQQANQLNDVGAYTSNIHSDGESGASGKAYGLNKSIYAMRTPRLNYYLSRTSYSSVP